MHIFRKFIFVHILKMHICAYLCIWLSSMYVHIVSSHIFGTFRLVMHILRKSNLHNMHICAYFLHNWYPFCTFLHLIVYHCIVLIACVCVHISCIFGFAYMGLHMCANTYANPNLFCIFWIQFTLSHTVALAVLWWKTLCESFGAWFDVNAIISQTGKSFWSPANCGSCKIVQNTHLVSTIWSNMHYNAKYVHVCVEQQIHIRLTGSPH